MIFWPRLVSNCPKISLYCDCGVFLFAGEVSWTDDVTGEVVSFTYTANENGYSAQVSGMVQKPFKITWQFRKNKAFLISANVAIL